MKLEDRLNKEGEKKKQTLMVDSKWKLKEESQIKSGFDIVLEVKVDEVDEIKRRLKGRKIDPVTKTIYHDEYNPIPTDVKGLNERLQDVTNVDDNDIMTI